MSDDQRLQHLRAVGTLINPYTILAHRAEHHKQKKTNGQSNLAQGRIIAHTDRSTVFATWRQYVYTHLIHIVRLAHASLPPCKRPLDRLSRFAGLTGVCNRQTERQTDTQTTERATCAAIGRSICATHKMRHNLSVRIACCHAAHVSKSQLERG